MRLAESDHGLLQFICCHLKQDVGVVTTVAQTRTAQPGWFMVVIFGSRHPIQFYQATSRFSCLLNSSLFKTHPIYYNAPS